MEPAAELEHELADGFRAIRSIFAFIAPTRRLRLLLHMIDIATASLFGRGRRCSSRRLYQSLDLGDTVLGQHFQALVLGRLKGLLNCIP